MTHRFILLFTFFLTVLCTPASAQDVTFEGLGHLGGNFSETGAVSADGSVVAGRSDNGVFIEAYRWTQSGGMEGLGTLGGNGSYVNAISADGLVIIGYSDNGVAEEAFRWTQGGGMVGLGTLGVSSRASIISTDGSVIAGSSDNGVFFEAFRWTQGGGMIGLGTLGGNQSDASTISSDGSVIAGYSDNGAINEAYRWTQGGGMVGLGTLGGADSYAYAISTDGSAIVGTSDNGVFYEAFRWTALGGMEALGTLGGVYSSPATISADGSVIAGTSDNGVFIEAFRWTQAEGMQSLRQIMTDAGVDMTGWDMTDGGNGVRISADGSVIVGDAFYLGNAQAYIFTMGGLTTPEDLVQSLTPVPVPQQQAQEAVSAGIGQSLVIARNAMSVYFPGSTRSAESGVSGGDEDRRFNFMAGHRKALYAMGSYGRGQNNDFSNDIGSGATGVLMQLSENMAAGIGVVGSYNREETRLGGESRTKATGMSVMAAHEALSGLRLYGVATVAAIDVSTDRHYMNGGGVDSSSGDTDGLGYGAAIKAGYEFGTMKNLRLMPYVELDVSHTSLDSYTETGGGFPAVVEDQSENFAASRLGLEISRGVTPDLTFRGRAAWGHRYTDGGATIATSAAITQSVTADPGSRNWAEGGLNMSYQLSDKITLTTDLSGRAGATAEPAVNATVGFVWKWD